MKKKLVTLFITGISALMLCSGCGSAASESSYHDSNGSYGASVAGYNSGYFADVAPSNGHTMMVAIMPALNQTMLKWITHTALRLMAAPICQDRRPSISLKILRPLP